MQAGQGSGGKELPQVAFQLFGGYHVFLYRLTGGLLGHRVGRLKLLLLDHVGSKSGKRYTSPLLYGQDGDNFVVVASKGGSVKDPAWYRNLVAHPDNEVQVGRRRIDVRARTATAAEKPRLWKIMADQWPGYNGYQRNTDREIPVVVLEPR
jgi:deazaflavin-dependent oxidoreductase (nitroreductase family)